MEAAIPGRRKTAPAAGRSAAPPSLEHSQWKCPRLLACRDRVRLKCRPAGRTPSGRSGLRCGFPSRRGSPRPICSRSAPRAPTPTAPCAGPPADRGLAGPTGFCVLGMGKLGGEELNFSSDADVVYVYDKDGRTQGPNPIDHFAFYARLAESVTASVGSPGVTPEGGFVFRVDLDLRPEGRSGPIVNAIRGLELYYEAHGSTWERFALLKARPIAGDLRTGEEALLRLTPFVFRKYFDLKGVDEMRQLKARAEKEAARAPGVDLKLGRGGIHEIQFFVQAP